ncbi:MAG: SDR family NAD(P)-dependent oxidoreductase [Chloroflexi bacterium]|nr:SDR family NAD(P)-dependent oxidoreductase [Chloroflexota bacterium]
MARIDLRDKVVIVTGASDGIGAMTAREFANAGSRVVLAARSEKALHRLADELGTPRALAVYTDMTDTVSVERMIERAINHFGQVDILVNNAGVGYFAPLSEVALDKAYQVFDVNFFGPLAAIQKLVPHWSARGDGHVINILTCAGRLPIPFQGVYGASKAAFIVLTDTLRIELARKKIAVTGVYPGTVNTQFEKHALYDGEIRTMCPIETGCGVPPEGIARGIVAAARKRPRDVWFSWQGRRYVVTGFFLPQWLDARMKEVRNAMDPPPPNGNVIDELLKPR